MTQNLILEGIYRKSYQKSIYWPFSNYRSNYRYQFNNYLNYHRKNSLKILFSHEKVLFFCYSQNTKGRSYCPNITLCIVIELK